MLKRHDKPGNGAGKNSPIIPNALIFRPMRSRAQAPYAVLYRARPAPRQRPARAQLAPSSRLDSARSCFPGASIAAQARNPARWRLFRSRSREWHQLKPSVASCANVAACAVMTGLDEKTLPSPCLPLRYAVTGRLSALKRLASFAQALCKSSQV